MITSRWYFASMLGITFQFINKVFKILFIFETIKIIVQKFNFILKFIKFIHVLYLCRNVNRFLLIFYLRLLWSIFFLFSWNWIDFILWIFMKFALVLFVTEHNQLTFVILSIFLLLRIFFDFFILNLRFFFF